MIIFSKSTKYLEGNTPGTVNFHNTTNPKIQKNINPSRIEWDLPNGPLSKLLEPLDTQV